MLTSHAASLNLTMPVSFQDEGTGPSVVENDTWLVSFIDILILLLTLFVLLLSQQDTDKNQNRNNGNDHEVLQATDNAKHQKNIELFIPQGGSDEILNLEVRFEPNNFEVDLQTLQPAPVYEPTQAAIQHEFNVPAVATVDAEKYEDTNSIPPNLESSSLAKISAVESIFRNEPIVEPQHEYISFIDQSDDILVAGITQVEKVLETIGGGVLKDRIEVSSYSGSVKLEINDSILFPPASAALTDPGMILLEELSGALKVLPYTVSVEGHTDNIPMETPQFPSNWELSSARASMVARYLIKHGISPKRIRAIGYSDTRPRSENETLEGRANNRRVSFLLQVPDSN